MIDPQVQEAVESRKSMGFTDEQITADFVAAGYTEEQIAAILAALASGPATVPAPSQSVTATPLAQEKKRPIVMIVGIILAVLTVALVITWLVMSDGVASFSRLFSSAPYQTEAELIENVLATSEQTNAYGFNMEYQFAVEERTDEAVELSADVLGESAADFLDYAAASLDAFPREIDARLFASGVMDLRDTENPSFDISARTNVVAEPVVFSGAGSARLVDGVGYGRIDDFPENMKPYLEDIPLETWIVLGSEDDVSLPNVPYIPVQSVEAVRRTLELYAEAVPPEFYIALQSLATTTNVERSINSVNQLAQLAAPLLEQSAEEESMAELQERVEALLLEYPPIMFVGEPENVDWFEESVYRYEFDVNSANIRQLVIAAAEEAGATVTPDMEAELDEIFSEINRVIDAVNTLTTFALYLRADGTSAGFSLDSVVALPKEVGYEPQFALRMKTHQTVQNDGLEIIAPADVHPLTLEEIEEEKRREQQAQFGDLITKQSLNSARAIAEISYNDNNYAYSAVCEDLTIEYQIEYSGCRNSAANYLVFSELTMEPGYYCIDSTGFAGTILDEPGESELRCSVAE